MSYFEELQKIQDSEINFEISCFWDNRWKFRLGDEMNGWIDEGEMNTLEECCEYLIKSVIEHYPKSQYVLNMKASK